ncbi:hypothetical protein I3843_06G130100 [Carya illinoinensis]|uniref:Uncharacterized protein n=1 Tax=Carya illinoinensis TaxID=32201 RepID=A0A8T1QBK1_CARIL|nr:organ-specific protein P4-like isoform X4 [Carya illinoinensis]KAG2703468.1 hypothetical protein I3760_06G138800 [Carya illinoinensis]KAG6651781.1 hypothetical protein CIPAW_06G136500 [Carya illinoinensis]KAG7976067.1 hypothetical protein I3843_06G130100 [Carya illinoinensis]
MKAHDIVWLSTLFSLLLFADSIEAARKDPGEYWVSVMKDEPMPEALQGLLPLDSSPSQPNKNANCHTSMGARNKDQVLVEYFELENGKPFVKNFKPRPNYVEYYSKDNVGRETEKKYVRDFKPRPNYVEYYSKDDVGGQTKKSFVRDFELKSNKDDDGPEVQRLYEKEIETTPDHTNYIYHE